MIKRIINTLVRIVRIIQLPIPRPIAHLLTLVATALNVVQLNLPLGIVAHSIIGGALIILAAEGIVPEPVPVPLPTPRRKA